MDTFPSGIRAPSRCPGGIFDPLDESTMDTGDDSARPVFSVPRQKPWKWTWEDMPFDEYELLVAFHAEQRASVWLYTHPRTGQTWEMRFKSDPIDYEEGSTAFMPVTCLVQPIRRVS